MKTKYLPALILVMLLVVQGCAIGNHEHGVIDAGENVDSRAFEGAARVSEFIIGPGDKLEIMVYRNDDLKRTVVVSPGGRISFPLIGDIQAAGVSIYELRDNITGRLARYIRDPQVTIGFLSTQSQKVTILGEVRRPGFFQADGVMTVLDVISNAGGFTLDAKQRSVLLIRGGMKDPTLKKLDLESALSDGDLKDNFLLQRGDIVYVPRTFIANVDRFFGHLSTIISPIVSMESGYFIGQRIESGSSTSVTVPSR
ncbi:MAG: polysaccharide biosynthesis/export family protein [Thermodesulfobacteriota bacterium]